ncbi:hypothetical protein PVK06_002947 [Gossypium arboreum]|uniref:Cardiomyopathy-associated protein 5 n=1 Tax=Gossypium arboreum TaxID=29729 RepID=A0ABR0R573_GOSAR|nr:hypothetical protein PVK06_002947 [Gossypium arboreum]
MSIDAKGIQLFVWRIIRFSGICCYKFGRKYPDVSGFLIFVFLLYIFFPHVFLYFMYISPIIVCTAVFIRFYFKTKYAASRWLKKKESADGKVVNTSNEASLRLQKSVRRNARKEVLEWDGKHSEEKDMLFVRSTCDSPSSKTNFLEENSKVTFDRVGSSSSEHGEGSPHDETGNPNLVFDSETSKPHRVLDDSFQGSSGTGPRARARARGVNSLEEANDAGNKATNRMDLGLTELERNKRLQSLIAKRRAKKLFRMAIEKSLMGINGIPPQIAPILTAKINNGEFSSHLDEDDLPMPGSAPSLLLPKQNSFDLPYDPLEEKPNLMADSFQQEFMPANLFCRHESFRHGPLFTFPSSQYPYGAEFNTYYSGEKRLFEWKPDKGGHHQLNSSGIENDIDLVEVEESNHNEAINLSEEKREKNIEIPHNRTEVEGEKMEHPHDLEPGLDSGSEVRMETDSIKNNNSCDSSSSENTEAILDQTSKSPGLRNDHVQRALKLAIPPKGRAINRLSFDSSPSPSERRRIDIHSFYSTYRRQCHTPTFSIASDLQVEVSEVGSPPLTTDGTTSPADGDSVIYDADVERDINSESEEPWGGSFNLSREEANRERLRELDDIIEEESAEVASISPSEHETKQNLNSKISLSSIVITENGASPPTYINSETHQDSSNCRHGSLQTFYESKSTMESGKEVKESHPSNFIEEDTQTLTEHKARDARKAVRSRDKLKSAPDIIVDQNVSENNILEQRLRESIARALNRRLMLDQFSVSSSSSPRSVLPQNILADQMPISEVAQRIQRNLSQSVGEDIVRHNLAYEQAHESFTSNRPRFSHEFFWSSMNRSFSSCGLGTLEAARKVIEAGNMAVNINNSAVFNKDEGEKLETNEGGSQFLIRPEDINRPEKSNKQEVYTDKTEAIESDYTSIVESAKERENSAAEVDRICKVNESVANNVINKEIKNDVFEGEEALRILGKLEAVIEPSNATGETNAGSVEDTEDESKRIAKAKATAGISTLTGETNSLNNIKNGEKIQNLTDQEGVMDASQSGEVQEENLKVIESILNVDSITKGISIDHDMTIKASKPTESEVKAAKMIKYDTGIDPSKSGKENAKSDDTETVEPTNSPRKVFKEGNNVVNIYDLGVIGKEGEKLTTKEGEFQFSIGQEGIGGPEKLNELEADLNKTEAIESDYTTIVETAKERENSAAEVDRICKVNESVSDNVTNKEIKDDVLEGEGALRILGKIEAVMEPLNTSRETSPGSIEDSEHKSKRLAKAEANASLSTSAGETNSLNYIKNGEQIQNMYRQEGIMGTSQSMEDNCMAIDSILDVDNATKGTSIDHEFAAKASKPKDSEHKSKRLAEVEANASLSTSAGETYRLNNIRIGQQMQNMSRQEGIMDTSQSMEDNLKALDSIPDVDNATKGTSINKASKPEDSEHKSKILAEAEANASLSTSAGEAKSLSSIKNGEQIQNMSRQQGIMDASPSGEDNLKAIDGILGVNTATKGTSINHDTVVRALAPTESEVKAVKTDEKDSNAVAK